MAINTKNNIELLLADSIYSINQFTSEQLKTLTRLSEDFTSLAPSDICALANPDLSELTYEIVVDYYSRHGGHIKQDELNNYIRRSNTKCNDLVCQAYIGKRNSLTDKQIDLYAQDYIPNIKIARLLVEKFDSKISEADLSTLIKGKVFKTTYGKLLIQDLLNGNIDIKKVLLVINESDFDDTLYNVITTQSYEFLDSIRNKDLKFDLNAAKLLVNICDTYEPINFIENSSLYSAVSNTCQSWSIKFESTTTFINFCNSKTVEDDRVIDILNKSTSIACLDDLVSFLKNNKYITSKTVKALNSYSYTKCFVLDKSGLTTTRHFFKIYNKYSKELIECNSANYYLKDLIKLPYDELCEALHNDCKSIEEYNNVKEFNTKNETLVKLLKLFKSKKEQQYIFEHLKEYDEDNLLINEVLTLKRDLSANKELIHYYIDNYLKAEYVFTPYTYLEEDAARKGYAVKEWLDFNKKFESIDVFRDYNTLKKGGANPEELGFFIENYKTLAVVSTNVQPALIQMFMDYGAENIPYAAIKMITLTNEDTAKVIENYTYAKSIFKDRKKCIGRFIDVSDYRVPKHLVPYIENFDDDTLYKVMIESPNTELIFIDPKQFEYTLKMSTVSTDTEKLALFYKGIDTEKFEKIVESDEPITEDVIIKFGKDTKLDDSIIGTVVKVKPIETVIKKDVIDHFTDSTIFKPIEYDDDITYVDIIDDTDLKDTHIITFNKESENNDYKYIFEIAHAKTNLTYKTKIRTKSDLVEAITTSLTLIEYIPEYRKYVDELQEILKAM